MNEERRDGKATSAAHRHVRSRLFLHRLVRQRRLWMKKDREGQVKQGYQVSSQILHLSIVVSILHPPSWRIGNEEEAGEGARVVEKRKKKRLTKKKKMMMKKKESPSAHHVIEGAPIEGPREGPHAAAGGGGGELSESRHRGHLFLPLALDHLARWRRERDSAEKKSRHHHHHHLKTTTTAQYPPSLPLLPPPHPPQRKIKNKKE